MPNPDYNLGLDAQKVEPLFTTAIEGDGTVLWAVIEAAVGKSRKELSSAVNTVRRRMFAQYGIDFTPILPSRGNTGFRVRTDAEQGDATHRLANRVRRQERRRRARMKRVDVTKLTTDEQLTYYSGLMRLDEVGKAASLATARKVARDIKSTHNMTTEERAKHIDILRTLWKKR